MTLISCKQTRDLNSKVPFIHYVEPLIDSFPKKVGGDISNTKGDSIHFSEIKDDYYWFGAKTACPEIRELSHPSPAIGMNLFAQELNDTTIFSSA